jgi:hypothetical protein
MGNLLGLFPNATPLVSRFTVIVSNNDTRISGKMDLTIEEKAILLEG